MDVGAEKPEVEVLHELCCIKCKDPASQFEDLTVVKKGLEKLIEYSKSTNNDQLTNLLLDREANGTIVRIHRECQKSVYNEMKRKSSEPIERSTKMKRGAARRSENPKFDWKRLCMFCEKDCVVDDRHPDRIDWRQVQVLSMRENLLDICSSRDDRIANSLEKKLLDLENSDLVAVEARYHFQCRKDFKLKLPEETTPGRPINKDRQFYFDEVCAWIESQAEIYTLSEIYNHMLEIASSEEKVYSRKWLKTKLKERYGDHVTFTEMEGKSTKVCFGNMVDYLITDKWYQNRKSDTSAEADRIVSLAAKIVLNDIRTTKFDCEWYPATDTIQSIEESQKWIPSNLQLFLSSICKNTLKQSSIGQAIVSAARPRSCIAPILFGLGVDVDHVFGSRWLIDHLNKLGFCISMNEVTRYKQSVMEKDSYDSEFSKLVGSFSQWSADNADHDVRTLDGKGSLHGMGIVYSTTNKFLSSDVIKEPSVRRNKMAKVTDLKSHQGIDIKNYTPSSTTGLSKLVFKNRSSLDVMQEFYAPSKYNILWSSALFLRERGTRPNWSGYMTEVCGGKYPGKSSVSFLPIIDLNPGDLSCIYSTLLFIIDQSKRINVEIPVVTFDQPLWLKATEVVNAKSLKVVLILGGFHLMMSFIGSVGHLMKGSGISEVLGTIYGENVVEHMLSGKAVSRALRGHFIVSSALNAKLLSSMFPGGCEFIGQGTVEEETEQDDLDNGGPEDDLDFNTPMVEKLTTTEVNNLKVLENKLKKDPNSAIDHLERSEEIAQLEYRFKEYKDGLASKSRTAKFWLQYLHYIDVLKMFIFAERSGNWEMHLTAISKMIDLFAATGHINYSKCARLYLQQMLELETTYPWVYTNFSEHGYHTVRRSDRFWAGLWTDLIIEQVLMRGLKSRGGLTRGRGVSESVRLMWLKTMHRCASIHNAMSNLTKVLHKTSEQHTELGQSRIKRDNDDLMKIINWFKCHNPFTLDDSSLRSLSTGLTASEENDLNCDDADCVGRSIQESLDGVCIEDAKIHRKDQVKTLESLRPGITIEKKSIHIDPAILFTRLTALFQREDSVVEHFSYELTPEPTSMFKDGMMRKSNKSMLRNIFLDKVESSNNSSKVCVLDGGALLHKVKWQANSTFKDILNSYYQYIKHKYVQYERCCVVFDGYTHSMSIKSTEHARRNLKIASANVTVSDTMVLTTSREMFLRNIGNKEQFIKMLGAHLDVHGLEVVYSNGDADVLIVQTALEKAISEEVTVSAEDTDILILLMSHWNRILHDMFFTTEVKEKSTKVVKSWRVSSLVETYNYREHLLFAHAWSECDSTSATHRQGKAKILKLLEDEDLRKLANLFGRMDSTHDDISQAGFKIMIKSYGGKSTDTLSSLRYTKFMESVSTSMRLLPENLPPTERAVVFHAYRVHLQVAQWKALSLDCLNPLDWGWLQKDEIIFPVLTDQEAAPESLLRFVRCKCKSSSKKPCSGNVCSCVRNGLKCVAACSGCRGESCCNSTTFQDNMDEENSNDIDEFDRNVFDLFM